MNAVTTVNNGSVQANCSHSTRNRSFYEVKADQVLKGHRITVSGKIDKIGKDILNTPYVTLKADDPIASVQVMFRGNENAIADLVLGHSLCWRAK